MADMTTIKGKIRDTIYPNGKGAITAEKHQSLLLDVVDNINEAKQDTLVSGQNIHSLVSGTSLLGSGILHELGTAFIYEYESEQVFAMMNGTREEVKPWMLNRATASQVAQSISILRQGVLQAIVPVVIKTRAEYTIICWEYDGLIYEIAWEDDAYKVVTKPKGDEFDKEGTYPSMHVGTADDLSGRGESVPASFGFRASGGKSIKDGRAYIKRIKGNSVVWNQKASFNILVDSLGIADIADIEGGKMITLTQDYTGSADYDIRMAYNGQLIAGHVYCVSMETYSSKGGRVNMDYGGSITNRGDISANTWSLVATIGVAASDKANFSIYPNFKSVGYLAGDTFGVRNVRVTDLTQLFQASNEPTTIEDFNARIATLCIEDMNAYNEGQVIHCNTESIKSVGDNAWDEEWEVGLIDYNNGELTDSAKNIRSKNFIKVLPNVTYSITCPQKMTVCLYDADKNYIGYVGGQTSFTTNNVHYIRFYTYEAYGSTYNHDIMITLVHSGWKQDIDAGYQPYWQDTLPLPIIRKYFPDGMKSAGTAHDEIRFNKASGKWEYSKGKIKSVDMGTLNWSEFSKVKGIWVSLGVVSLATHTSSNSMPSNLLCGKYINKEWFSDKGVYQTIDGICIDMYGYLYLGDSSYTDAASFKAAMQGVILYYESNDWEWVELDAEDQNFRDYYNVADFGTEQSQSNNVPSAPFSADIIYQFNAVDMIREHELEITELQNVIATMQAQLTALTNGGQ